MPCVRCLLPLIWGLIAILGSIALAFVTGLFNPQEKINGLWLVVAAACMYVLAFRFYGRWFGDLLFNWMITCHARDPIE